MKDKTKMLKVFCDGGSRGNPGPAAAGVVICDTDNKVLSEHGRYLGIATNNFAEYSAVLLALDELKQYEATKIDFYLDSELVVRQLNGQYKIKHEGLKPLFAQIKRQIDGHNISFHHVPREQNKLADAQVNKCLDVQVLD